MSHPTEAQHMHNRLAAPRAERYPGTAEAPHPGHG